MTTALRSLLHIDILVLIAMSGLCLSFLMSVTQLGLSLAKAGKRS